MIILLWPKIYDVGAGVNGNHNVHAPRLDKKLAYRNVLLTGRAINKLQPPRVQILEVGFPRKVVERL
jgi:hypothetical protein